MKVSPVTLILIGMLAGALAWGSCSSGRASEAELRLRAALTRQDSAAATWAGQRDSLNGELRGLRADSALLAVRYAISKRAASASQDSLNRLLAALPDSDRSRFQQALAVIRAEAENCGELLENCEHRAFNAEAQAHGDSVQLAATRAMLDTSTEALWQANKRAQPSFFRDLWRSRSVTIPLAALTTILLLKR